mmetsp:Transcript_19798/g.53421  ORF Transcript_19798/g.53421 Transcript_19798/m.53421 type:complete len:220 (+) Transcript_19798:669-1328(+)
MCWKSGAGFTAVAGSYQKTPVSGWPATTSSPPSKHEKAGCRSPSAACPSSNLPTQLKGIPRASMASRTIFFASNASPRAESRISASLPAATGCSHALQAGAPNWEPPIRKRYLRPYNGLSIVTLRTPAIAPWMSPSSVGGAPMYHVSTSPEVECVCCDMAMIRPLKGASEVDQAIDGWSGGSRKSWSAPSIGPGKALVRQWSTWCAGRSVVYWSATSQK